MPSFSAWAPSEKNPHIASAGLDLSEHFWRDDKVERKERCFSPFPFAGVFYFCSEMFFN